MSASNTNWRTIPPFSNACAIRRGGWGGSFSVTSRRRRVRSAALRNPTRCKRSRINRSRCVRHASRRDWHSASVYVRGGFERRAAAGSFTRFSSRAQASRMRRIYSARDGIFNCCWGTSQCRRMCWVAANAGCAEHRYVSEVKRNPEFDTG